MNELARLKSLERRKRKLKLKLETFVKDWWIKLLFRLQRSLETMLTDQRRLQEFLLGSDHQRTLELLLLLVLATIGKKNPNVQSVEDDM